MIAHSENELCEECKKFDLYVNHGGDPNAGFCNDVLVVCNHTNKKPYNIVNVEQRSPEWFKWKQWKIGGSYAPTIMGENPFESIEMLYQKIVEGHEVEMTFDMQRGIDLEPEALLLLNTRITGDFKPRCFESLEYHWAIASADGWSDELEVGLEIKCPGRFSKDQSAIPLKYKAQVQHCMFISGASKWYYAEYVGREMWHCTVDRDEEYIKKLIEKEKQFHKRLMNFDAPIHEHEEDWSKLI